MRSIEAWRRGAYSACPGTRCEAPSSTAVTLPILRRETGSMGARHSCAVQPDPLVAEVGDHLELAATTWAQVHGKPRAGKQALGWDAPLTSFRPFQYRAAVRLN
jgi:hypothetical protein